MSKSSSETCPYCGRPGVLTRVVARSYGKGASLLVIEGVPFQSCPHCGEGYFTPETLHEVERIRSLRKAVSVVRPVAVASFA
jgi:YgiT-type zinc finger domain-containing protein